MAQIRVLLGGFSELIAVADGGSRPNDGGGAKERPWVSHGQTDKSFQE